MLFVRNAVKAQRLATCQECEHFVHKTRSCGPLVTEAFTDSPLCGCHMPTKARLKVASCPLDKWPATLSAQDIADLRKFLETDIRYLTNEDLQVMHNRMTGENNQRTSCQPCQNKMYKELTNHFLQS